MSTTSPAGEVAVNDANEACLERKYQRLIEEICGDYVIYTHDPEGNITYVSPSVEAVLGYPATLMQGRNWREFVGENFIGREIAERVDDEVAAGKTFHHFTFEIAHASGSTRLLDIQQRPLFDTDGNYVSMEGIAKDITEQMRVDEELRHLKQNLESRVAERTAELIRSNELLRKSEARYRSFVECQTEFVVRWLPGTVITFVNEAYCRFAHRSSDELLGSRFMPLIHPADVDEFQAIISQLSADSPYAIFELRVVMPDGSAHWTQWTNQMLFDEDGEFLEYQSVGRDITELRDAADIIREQEAHLAYMSRVATTSEIISGLAHEIHQPLHAAKTFAEAARRNIEIGEPSNIETAIDCTNEISQAVNRTAEIIRRLRDFTRSRPVKFEPLDLRSVVCQACELIDYEIRQAQAKIEFTMPDELPLVQGDRVQMQQICVNLLMNAFESMSDIPPEDRQVEIRFEQVSGRMRLSFTDAGCATAVEHINQIFTAFYTTKPNRAGMGLSICKSITEIHGGNIWGILNRDKGMTFVLELPLMRRAAREHHSQTRGG